MFPLFGLLHRMIFWELVRVFLLSLAGLTGLFLLAGLIQQAAQLGLSPDQILKVIPLLIPSTLPYTIPATTLFASCVVYGRLSADNEAVAMKAAGVDLLTALRPAILIGILTTIVTAALYHTVIPRTQQILQEQLLQDPEEVLYNLLRTQKAFRPSNFPYAIYVRDVQGKRLIDVILKRRAKVKAPDGNELMIGYDVVARAREARLVVNLEKRTLSIDPDRWVVTGPNSHLVTEGNKPIEVDLPEMFSSKNVKSRPMALEWDELPTRIAELVERREIIEARRDANRRTIEEASDPGTRQNAVNQEPHYEAQVNEANRQIRTVEFEQYMRPALAAGCFCFAVIGCPVGIWANRSDYLSTFVTCFLPTVFVYYPVMLAGSGLARDGKVPMLLGVWAANIVAGSAAMLLTYRLIRR